MKSRRRKDGSLQFMILNVCQFESSDLFDKMIFKKSRREGIEKYVNKIFINILIY